MTSDDSTRCEFIKEDGNRCKNRASSSSPYCKMHQKILSKRQLIEAEKRRQRNQLTIAVICIGVALLALYIYFEVIYKNYESPVVLGNAAMIDLDRRNEFMPHLQMEKLLPEEMLTTYIPRGMTALDLLQWKNSEFVEFLKQCEMNEFLKLSSSAQGWIQARMESSSILEADLSETLLQINQLNHSISIFQEKQKSSQGKKEDYLRRSADEGDIVLRTETRTATRPNSANELARGLALTMSAKEVSRKYGISRLDALNLKNGSFKLFPDVTETRTIQIKLSDEISDLVEQVKEYELLIRNEKAELEALQNDAHQLRGDLKNLETQIPQDEDLGVIYNTTIDMICLRVVDALEKEGYIARVDVGGVRNRFRKKANYAIIPETDPMDMIFVRDGKMWVGTDDEKVQLLKDLLGI